MHQEVRGTEGSGPPLTARAWRDESGVTATEYALLGAIVSVSIVVVLVVAGDAVLAMYESVGDWVAWGADHALGGSEQPGPGS